MKALNNFITGLTYFLLGFVVTAALMYSCSGCGYRQSMRIGCHWDTQICDNLFGKDEYELQNQVDQNTKDVANIKKELETMQTVLDMSIQDISLYQQQLTTLQSLVAILQVSTINNEDNIVELQQQIESLTERIDYQQVIVNNMQIEISNLAISGDPIVEYYDVCGNGPGFDEILLRTRSGKYIAYMEETGSSKRFLTILQSGTNYVSTDTQKCFFTLNNAGQIVNEHL